ncbi:response regulator transcription factor [Planosporangium flavigriseum]|uniref:DNA-binding response regulator n=1 Tax=Planosporangium flavigriseum TaxID=373681 RepID=A0A8J3LMX0_9ACTN|nr:response regulator transcription factor [Planosporangium flavigriseum]NJC67587.1 response regulator transcription factor [Planosporangium flavigriseum]GIG75657.1 DNA-binding response regulator [Planosporangium flavigriseum]
MTSERRHRILIVEDHQVVAEGLAALLGEHPDLEVVGIAGSVADVERWAGSAAVDVAVVDYWLPDGTGVDATAVLRRYWPEIMVLFLSADDSDESMLAALETAASGYLIKSAGGADVTAAVRRAAEGEIVVPARQLAALLARRREQAQRQAERARMIESLTPRERQILGLMAEGMDNRDIARQLGVSYTTVRSHVRHLLNKLSAHSKLEAVVKAAEWGLSEWQH